MKTNHIVLIATAFLFITGCATSLNNAIRKGDLGAIKSIIGLDKGQVHNEDDSGLSLLHQAVWAGHLDVVAYLVTQGADVNAKDLRGDTPLYIAFHRGFDKISEYLIFNDADLNNKNIYGETPLFAAVNKGELEMVKQVVSHGSNVNIKNQREETPLHIAAKNGRFKIVKFLVTQGADVNIKNDSGKTPYYYADLFDFSETASFLAARMKTASPKSSKSLSGSLISAETDIVDKTPPKIIIFSHDISRGIKITQNKAGTTIRGRAIDNTKIAQITVNNEAVFFDGSGSFEAELSLGIGQNTINVNATDIHNNRSNKTFIITRAVSKPLAIPTKATPPSSNYYALVIGNNNYTFLRNLETAKNDAQVVSHVLKRNYKFNSKLLLDAGREDILDALNYYRKILKDDDHFLIYYAGHGVFDQKAGKAYWLPVDAQIDNDKNWIIVDTITSNIKRISSDHVLIIADSCYSGTFTRTSLTILESAKKRDRYLKKMQAKKSRTILASGGNEPVSDIGGEGHSVFAKAFISGLKNIEQREFTAEELYYQFIREMVAGSSEQTPEYNIIRNSGHEGGDFVFVRKPQ